MSPRVPFSRKGRREARVPRGRSRPPSEHEPDSRGVDPGIPVGCGPPVAPGACFPAVSGLPKFNFSDMPP